MPFKATWMDLEMIIQSEVSQTEKDKYYMISLICGILKNDTNKLIYKTEIDSQTNKRTQEGSQTIKKKADKIQKQKTTPKQSVN